MRNEIKWVREQNWLEIMPEGKSDYIIIIIQNNQATFSKISFKNLTNNQAIDFISCQMNV